MPAFEIEEFDSARNSANVRVRMIRGNLHPHFELPTARKAFGGIEQPLRVFSFEYFAVRLFGYLVLLLGTMRRSIRFSLCTRPKRIANAERGSENMNDAGRRQRGRR
jgi:hypothetical protein